jgi:hypothetical protein
LIVFIRAPCHFIYATGTKELEEEFIMGSDVIVILGLAVIFFGGIGYIMWKERNRQKPQGSGTQDLLQDSRPPIEALGKRK